MVTRNELQERLQVEEAEMRAALVSVRDRPGALAALRTECERTVQYAEARHAACKAVTDQAIEQFRKAIASQDPLPQAVERFFMARYLLEVERADHDVKVARRLRDLALGATS